MAAERGHLDVVKYLVGQEADINIKDDYGVRDNDETRVVVLNRNIIPSRISSASPCLTRYSAELPLRVGLICAS